MFLLLNLLIASCSITNEFGNRRNKFSIKKISANKDLKAYEIIDTSKIYKLINIKAINDEKVSSDLSSLNEKNPSYLKFYENGRVGEFINIDIEKIETFNPKKAKSHLYSLKKNKIVVQEYFKHTECGECFIKKILTKNSENKIILSSENYIETYIEIEIPKKYLIYKPDW